MPVPKGYVGRQEEIPKPRTDEELTHAYHMITGEGQALDVDSLEEFLELAPEIQERIITNFRAQNT